MFKYEGNIKNKNIRHPFVYKEKKRKRNYPKMFFLISETKISSFTSISFVDWQCSKKSMGKFTDPDGFPTLKTIIKLNDGD